MGKGGFEPFSPQKGEQEGNANNLWLSATPKQELGSKSLPIPVWHVTK